jgi:hypothetical protein
MFDNMLFERMNIFRREVVNMTDFSTGPETLIWRCNSMNVFDEFTQFTYGNNLVTTKTFENFGNLQNKITCCSMQTSGIVLILGLAIY